MEKTEAMSFLLENKKVKELTKFFFNEQLTPKQEQIVRVIAYDEHPRVVISCMTRYGKSWSVSIGLLLWILLNKGKRLVIVAPTNEKTSIIRNHMVNFIVRSRLFMNLLDIDKRGSDKIRKEVSKNRMTWKHGVEVRTLTAEGEGAALMGHGADKIVVDEECDINHEVYRAKISRMLGDNPDSTYVGIGNPWHRDNHMWQHWINPKWLNIHIDWRIALREGRISQAFVDEQKAQLTPMEFEILYEANFPKESVDQLISWEWINNAVRPIPNITTAKVQRLGCDVARMGMDLTVITKGFKAESLYVIEEIENHSKEDTMQTVGRIRTVIHQRDTKRACIDTDGLGGGVSDRLQELKDEGLIDCEIIQFHGGGNRHLTEDDKLRFLNHKAKAYFHLRDLFEKGNIIIPNHAKLKDQLSKMKWKPSSSNKIKILDPGEAIDDKSEKKSPDFSDSTCYFCWDNESRVFTV